MRNLDLASAVLMFIGAINWGFVGIFDVNLIDFFIENPLGDRLLYSLIGLAAVYKAIYWKAIRVRWKEDKA